MICKRTLSYHISSKSHGKFINTHVRVMETLYTRIWGMKIKSNIKDMSLVLIKLDISQSQVNQKTLFFTIQIWKKMSRYIFLLLIHTFKLKYPRWKSQKMTREWRYNIKYRHTIRIIVWSAVVCNLEIIMRTHCTFDTDPFIDGLHLRYWWGY